MTLRLPPPGFLHVHPAWLFVAAVFFAIASVLSIGMFQIPAGGMALNQNTLLAAGGVAVVAVLGVAGVWFLRLACHLAWTQTEVRLDNHRLEVVLTGLAERHYSWSRARILGVTVQPEAPPRKKGQWPVLHVAVNLENGRAFPLLTGRPEEELRWVVRMLREGLERIPATDERSLETLIAARPPESRAVLESVVGVVTLELPPPGWQSTSVLVTTTGVVFLASAGFWGWLLARTPGPWLGGWWAQPLGAAAAGVFGLAALLEVALARWRDHLRVTISDDELVWHQPGWFRTTVYRWQRSEIAAIDVVHESLTDRHFYFLPELVIRFRSGRKKKLLLYHPGEEISWVVEILRHFLLRTAIRSS